MIILYMVIGIFLGVLIFLLLTPVILEIDSPRKMYELRLAGIAGGRVIFSEDGFIIEIRIFGWRKSIDPFEPGKKSKKKETEKPPKKKKRRSFAWIRKKAFAVIRSFTVEYFYLDFDSGDYCRNAIIYPAALLLSSADRTVKINFQGETIFRLKIVNRLGRMAIAFIK